MTLDTTIRAVQAKLGVTVDGNPGPQTWNSIYRSLVGEPDRLPRYSEPTSGCSGSSTRRIVLFMLATIGAGRCQVLRDRSRRRNACEQRRETRVQPRLSWAPLRRR